MMILDVSSNPLDKDREKLDRFASIRMDSLMFVRSSVDGIGKHISLKAAVSRSRNADTIRSATGNDTMHKCVLIELVTYV